MGAAGPVGSPVGLASVVRLMAVLVTALSVQSLAVILLGRARVFSHCNGSGRWHGVGAAGPVGSPVGPVGNFTRILNV